MPITEAFTGSATISTTEISMTTGSAGLQTQTSDGVFQVFIDFNAVAYGDEFSFKVYEKTRAADTQRIIYEAYISGPQSTPIFVAPSLILMNGWDMSLIKKAGTDRVITWSIRQVA